jgi:hypothetical protein
VQTSTAGRAATTVAALLTCVAVPCIACSPTTPRPGPTTTATPVGLSGLHVDTLPGDLQPSALTISGGSLVVVGHRPSAAGRAPAAAIVADGGARSVPVRPASPYGAVADLVSVATDGSQLAALGAARGGAHANARWTIWTGTTQRLVDRPQTFETFGGWSAGSLTGVVGTPDGPRVVGSWQGRSGLDIAVWRPDGERWVRVDSGGTPLANSAKFQVSGRSVAPTEHGMIITGSLVDLSGGVRQSAAVWMSAGSDRDWRLIRLPEPGRRSEALSARCTAGTCWVAGHVDGRLAVWRVSADGADRDTAVPEIAIDDSGPLPRVAGAAPAPVVAFSANGRVALLARSSGTWTVRAGPTGALVAAAEVRGRIYLAASGAPDRSELWSADLP